MKKNYTSFLKRNLIRKKNHSDPTVPIDYELYDYETDPWEKQNHYNAKPDVAKKLKAILDKYPAPKTRK